MIKRYCDICGNHVYDVDNVTITSFKKESVWRKVTLKVIVSVKVGKEQQNGDMCKGCLIEYINVTDKP